MGSDVLRFTWDVGWRERLSLLNFAPGVVVFCANMTAVPRVWALQAPMPPVVVAPTAVLPWLCASLRLFVSWGSATGSSSTRTSLCVASGLSAVSLASIDFALPLFLGVTMVFVYYVAHCIHVAARSSGERASLAGSHTAQALVAFTAPTA